MEWVKWIGFNIEVSSKRQANLKSLNLSLVLFCFYTINYSSNFIFYIRTLCQMSLEDPLRQPVLILLEEMYNKQPKLGYYFLYFLKIRYVSCFKRKELFVFNSYRCLILSCKSPWNVHQSLKEEKIWYLKVFRSKSFGVWEFTSIFGLKCVLLFLATWKPCR